MVYIYCVQTWLHTIIIRRQSYAIFYFSVQVGGFFSLPAIFSNGLVTVSRYLGFSEKLRQN